MVKTKAKHFILGSLHPGKARSGRFIPFDAIRDDRVTMHTLENFAEVEDYRATVNAMAANVL